MNLRSKRAKAMRSSSSIRDNFPRKVVEALKQRVAGTCSNPKCGVQTLAPGSEPLAVSNIGHAAHIYAAAPGGPRFDPKMTREERREITNGIWLCASCATLIDRDPEHYSPSLLRRWRHDAEIKAKQSHGKRPPQSSDAIETLVVAMTGRGSQFIPSAIVNTHMATQQSLQELDPRFSICTSYVDGITKIQINAKEDVPFSISVDKQHAAKWSSGFEAVAKKAQEVTLPMTGVTFSGSRLLEALTGELIGSRADLTITPAAKPAVIKLFSGTPNVDLDNINGRIFAGRDALRFEGSIYEGLVTLTLSIENLQDKPANPKFTVLFDLSRWNGRPIADTKFLNKILDLIGSLANPENFRATLEVDGNSVIRFTNPNVRETAYFQAIETTAHYLHRAKVLANYLRINLNVDLNYQFSADEHELLADAVRVIEGRKVYESNDFLTPPEASITTRDVSSIEHMIQEAQSVWKIEQSSRMIRVFGGAVQLPNTEILLMNCNVEITKRDYSTESPEEVNIALRFGLTPEFRCIYRFNQQLRLE